MIKCDHCGFWFPEHRLDAFCPIGGCPHMERRNRQREENWKRIEESRAIAARED